jgi:hypothetical protein
MAEDIYRHKYRHMVIEDFIERILRGDHAFSSPWIQPLSNEGLLLGGPDPEIEKELSGRVLLANPFGPQGNIPSIPGVSLGIPGALNVSHISGSLHTFLRNASPAAKANYARSFRRNHTDVSIVQQKIRDKFSNRNNREALALLMQDNELRVCASLAFPRRAKGILIEADWGLRTAMMVLECEGRAEAAQESIALELAKNAEK